MTVSLRNTPVTADPAGGGSTVSNNRNLVNAPPTPSLATTVYVSGSLALVGVPDTMPVTGSSIRPAGSGGTTIKASAWPVSVGTNGVSATPTVPVTGFG